MSLDFALNAPPGTFLVERFTKMEMLNIECSSRMNSRPESTLAEIASYSHPTFRNLLIEGHIRVDSSICNWARGHDGHRNLGKVRENVRVVLSSSICVSP